MFRIPIVSDFVDAVVNVFTGGGSPTPTGNRAPTGGESGHSDTPMPAGSLGPTISFGSDGVSIGAPASYDKGVAPYSSQVYQPEIYNPNANTGIPILAIPVIASETGELLYKGATYAIDNPISAVQTGVTAYSYYKNPKKLLSDLGIPDLSKYIPQSNPSYDPFQGVVNNQNAPDQTAVFVSNQSKAGALLIFAAVAGITFLMLKKKGK